MTTEAVKEIIREQKKIDSVTLQRIVKLECFLPTGVIDPASMALLLINDGQDMDQMNFHSIISDLYEHGEISAVLCVGIHAGEDRKQEYGTASQLDYKRRGRKAAAYTAFVLNEVIPYIQTTYKIPSFRETAFAGFSLGGLSALDIAWKHRKVFKKVGLFSGSFWWRKKDIEDGYNEDTDRIMHAIIRSGSYAPGMKFFFQTGTEDETADRNNNGIIDSIDDTLALIEELKKKGYKMDKDIAYLEMEGGK